MCAWAPNYLVTYSGISRQDCPPGVGPVVDTGGVSRFGRRIMLGHTWYIAICILAQYTQGTMNNFTRTTIPQRARMRRYLFVVYSMTKAK